MLHSKVLQKRFPDKLCQQEKLSVAAWANIWCIFHLYFLGSPLLQFYPIVDGIPSPKTWPFVAPEFLAIVGRQIFPFGNVPIFKGENVSFGEGHKNLLQRGYSTTSKKKSIPHIRFPFRCFRWQTGGLLPDSCLERLPAVIDLRFVSEGATFFFAHGTVEFYRILLGKKHVCFFFCGITSRVFFKSIYRKPFLKSRIGCTMENNMFLEMWLHIWVFPKNSGTPK